MAFPAPVAIGRVLPYGQMGMHLPQWPANTWQMNTLGGGIPHFASRRLAADTEASLARMGVLAEDLRLLAAELEAAMSWVPLENTTSSSSWASIAAPSVLRIGEAEVGLALQTSHDDAEHDLSLTWARQPERMDHQASRSAGEELRDQSHSRAAVHQPACDIADAIPLHTTWLDDDKLTLSIAHASTAVTPRTPVVPEEGVVVLDEFKSLVWQPLSTVLVEEDDEDKESDDLQNFGMDTEVDSQPKSLNDEDSSDEEEEEEVMHRVASCNPVVARARPKDERLDVDSPTTFGPRRHSAPVEQLEQQLAQLWPGIKAPSRALADCMSPNRKGRVGDRRVLPGESSAELESLASKRSLARPGRSPVKKMTQTMEPRTLESFATGPVACCTSL
mmetsp:Transcript_10987/g.19879  ORF Transcript_10987/g.19879 Transcript_10987/m.19879 type:complete len:390 (+) Transcript_10987:49-1218(+)